MIRADETTYSRWWIAIAATVVVVLCGATMWFYNHQKSQQNSEVAEHLSAIAELKIKQIVNWRHERSADAAVLMEREYLLKLIQSFLDHPDPDVGRQIDKRLRRVKESYQYGDILLVDLDKRVRLRLLPERTGHFHEGYEAAMDAAMAGRKPAWTPVHFNAGAPAPHVGVVVPLFAPDDAGKPLGALVLICDTQQFLYPLVQSWPTPSKTAEILIVRREGDHLVYLSDLRRQERTALTLRAPLTRTTLPEVMAVTGKQGFVIGTDYHGSRVAAVVLPIPDSPWFLVAKIDLKEAYAEWHLRLVMTLLLVLILIGLLAVIGLAYRQRSLKSHYRDLYHSESALNQAMQRHSITLQSIGDGVIATDARGCIELMNRMAEKITGWPLAEAMGRPVTEVFKIIDEETREPVENPVTCVLLKECGVVTLAGNTLLIARDGSEIPIADSGAPIRNDQNETIGVVLVFKDRSRERAYQKMILESEEKYRHIADNSLDVIWTMNLDLVFTYVNPAVYPLAGFTQEEWIGSQLQSHCDAENFAKMAEVIVTEMAKGPDGKGVIFEAAMLRKDGDSFPVEIRGKVNYDTDGNPISLQGVTRDITERKQAEADLRHKDLLLREIGGIAKIGGWEFDLVTGEGTWTDEVSRMHELPADAPITMQARLRFYSGESRVMIERAVANAIEQGEPYDLELEMVTAAGHPKWVRVIGRPQFDKGKVVKVRGSIQDITHHKAAEKERQASETRFRVLVENAPDGIFVQTNDRFAYLNQSAVKLFGAGSARELIGQPVFDRVHPDYRQGVQQRMVSLNQERMPVTTRQEKLIKMDGTPFDTEGSAVPMEYEGIQGALVFVRDISERIEGERQRQKLQEQLHHAQKMESVGRLAGGVAHDYNNILSVIIGYTELCLADVDPDSLLHANLREVYNAAQRSKAVTRQLLAFARKEAIVPEVLDLNATVESMLMMIRRLIGEHVDLTWLPGGGLWPVRMDPSQIDQILANLCVNARDAIETAGRVTIETDNRVIDATYPSSHGEVKPGDYVCLSVSDTGRGMSREIVKNIFEPFFTTKEVGKGTGLGLATIYGITRQNDGFINVYSEPGAGTAFRIFLPRCQEAMPADDPQSLDECLEGRGERILLVEDEPSILELTSTMLTQQGYTVLTAGTPAEALNLARTRPDDVALLITDVIMPEMNGRQLAEALQAYFPHLKSIFMSGYTADIIVKSGVVEAGVNFLQKPFSSIELGRKVHAVLNTPPLPLDGA